jgi:tetratricopeptide (TPR) repeat protein
MRWHSWLYISVVELISAVLAAGVGILSNVLTNEKHPEKIVVVAIIAFVVISGILQGVRYGIAERKSRSTDRALKGVQETTRQILSNQQEAANERAERQFDDLLQHFPDIFRSWIKAQWVEDPNSVKRILDALSEPTLSPSSVAQEWQHSIPDWLASIGWRGLLVAGELANAYGSSQASSQLFLLATSAGSTRQQYWAARAALLRKFEDKAQEASDLLARGGVSSESPDSFARIVYHFAVGDDQTAQTLLEAWEPEMPIDILLAANIRVTIILSSVADNTQPTPSQWSRVASVFRTTIQAIPYSASPRLGLARALISAVATDASTDRHRDLQEALDQALRARDLLRNSRSRSVEAVEAACQAAYSDMQFSRVIEIGTAVTGEALLAETSSDIVRGLVASAALIKGQKDLADRLTSEITEPFLKAHLLAISAEVEGHPSADLWRTALAQAGDASQRTRALLGLARMGITQLPRPDDEAGISPHDTALIQAVAAAASGNLASAIQQLRAMSSTDLGAVTTLVDVYLQAQNVSAAVDVLREGARTLNDPRLRVEAARLLWQDDRKDDARIELEQALNDSEGDQDLRHDCLVLLGQWAADQHQWVRAQERFQQVVALDPYDSKARWAVILLMLRRGLITEAIGVYESAPSEPAITYPEDARAWMTIESHTEHSDPAAFVTEVLSVAGRFPDDEDVQAEAIFAVLSPDGRDSGPLPSVIQAQFNEFCERFFKRWPNSPRLRRYDASDIQALVSQMEELVRPTQQEKTLRAEVADKLARNTIPWALLSALTNRSYSEILIVRAGGVLPAQHIDPNEQQICRDAAQASLDKGVVLDLSAAAVIMELADLGNLLSGQFERLIVSEGERLDAAKAVELLRARSTSSWAYDEQSDRGRLVEISAEAANERYDKAVKLLDLVNRCRVVPDPTDPRLDEFRELATSSWATAVQHAAQTGSAFWCDDVALRGIARSVGVHTFSTPSLLQALAEGGALTAEQHESAIRRLIKALVGDFILDQARLSTLTSEDNGVAGPVASIFSRSAAWLDVNAGYQIWINLAEQAVAVDRRYAADWLYAAVIGLTRPQTSPNMRKEAAALLLSGATTLVSGDTEAVARCVVATRAALAIVRRDDNDDDPLGRAAQIIRATILQQVGLMNATTYVSRMFAALDADDRYQVLQALYVQG